MLAPPAHEKPKNASTPGNMAWLIWGIDQALRFKRRPVVYLLINLTFSLLISTPF
jgi:hypothetical protein